MAEIPDVNPLRPIWPTRPDERGRGHREREGNAGEDRSEPEQSPRQRKPDADDDHHIDEYV